MRVVLRVVGLATAAAICASCASPTPAPVETSTAGATLAPVAAATPTAAPTPSPTPAATTAPTPSPSSAGTVVLASKLYPYELTVPAGAVSFVDAMARWDGAQKLSTDARFADKARAPGTSAIWLTMTDTSDGIEAYADAIDARFRAWHGCVTAPDRRTFSVGDLQGVAFSQSCAGGAMHFARVAIVGHGRALVAFSDGGTLDDLVGVMGGLRFVEP